VIFSHPTHIYHPVHMPAFAQPHMPSNPTHAQLEPVDLSVSKRSSSSSSPPCSSASSSPASSRSSPPSPYSAASRASPRCSTPHAQLRSSPSHALPPPTPSLPYHSAMVTPLMSSGTGVIHGSGVMMSPVMVPLSVLYPSPLHLHQSILVSPPVASDDDHHRSREHKTGEASDIILFTPFVISIRFNFISVPYKWYSMVKETSAGLPDKWGCAFHFLCF